MQKPKQIFLMFLLPSLILGFASACTLAGGESSSDQTDGTAVTSEATTAEPVAEEQEPVEVQEATTVFAAAQLIDLGFLSLPTEIKAMGRSEVGHKSFELWDDVASVVGLYEPTFIEDGWQNDGEQEYTDETTANRYFRKDGFVVSMSVRSLGEGTLVSFVNHGNLDVGSLAQTTDAQPIYQLPGRLVYVSPSTVNDVTDFTRQELAAQGWNEYATPGTASADHADSQTLMFIQNGLELSATIRAAPDQGDQTEVEYSITLLPLDLPVYDEPLGLEFGRSPPYLRYKTATDIDTLASFYRAEMSNLGWTEIPETASVTPEQVDLFFVGQRFYANDSANLTAKLQLTLVDGQTEVTLQQADVDRIAP